MLVRALDREYISFYLSPLTRWVATKNNVYGRKIKMLRELLIVKLANTQSKIEVLCHNPDIIQMVLKSIQDTISLP